MSLYDRQKSLDLKAPESVMVLGVGGVGAWVALNLALSGVNKLTLVDPDTVEESNLNRTPFRSIDIGTEKVSAMTALIYERRKDVIVSPWSKKSEDMDEQVGLEEVIVDCRDRSEPLYDSWQSRVRIIGGYDGMNITIHFNPDPKSIWGESTGYTVIPSWLAPPQLIANIITGYLMCNMTCDKELVTNFKITDLIEKLKGGINGQ